MAVDLEKLVVQLSADVKGYENALAKAAGLTARQMRGIERQLAQTDKRLSNFGRNFGSALAGAGASLGAVFSVREVIAYADAWTRVRNSLKVAGVPAQQLEGTLSRLFDIAQGAGAGIEPTVQLFSRLSQSAAELGASQEDLFRFTKGIGDALKVAGTDAQSASGALLQLSQALGGAVVRAEEFNSINEGARPILQAVADGLDEAGGSVAKLRALVLDGAVSSRAFFEAFLRGSQGLAAQADQASTTFSQAFTKIENAFTRYIGQTDESLGASQRLIAGLESLADNFDETADAVVAFASILAAGLLGRSIAGLVAGLATAGASLAAFVTAVRNAKNIGALGAALGTVGTKAGPIGAAIAVAAAAAVLFAGSSSDAEENAALLTEELDRLGIKSRFAKTNVEGLDGAVDGLADNSAADRIARVADEIARITDGDGFAASLFDALTGNAFQTIDTLDEVRSAIVETKTSVTGFLTLSGTDNKVLDELYNVVQGFQDGEIAADEAIAILDEFRKLELSDPVLELVKAFDAIIQRTDRLIQLQGRYNQTLGASPGLVDERGADLASQREARQLGERRQQFFRNRNADASQSDAAREIERRTRDILKASEEAGAALSEGAARIQAEAEIAAEALAKSTSQSVQTSAELIKQFEGFRSTPYYDVNAYRAGFGSDTVTLSDGTIREVTQGITVSLADANRDLARRVEEFQNIIRGQIGADTFAQFTADQQAALTSIAYNYGSLPDRIVRAILDGTQADIVGAIEGLKSDNGGINAGRRQQEADIFLNGVPEQLRQIVEARRELNLAQSESLEGLRAEGEAYDLNAAMAEAAYDELAAAQERAAQLQEDVQQAFQGAFTGFVQDILSGKDAMEALADSVAQLGQRLVDLALNEFFTQLFGGGFGGFGGGLFSLFGFANGGYTGRGSKMEPAGIVHKGEYDFDKDAVDRIGVSNLEAIRKGIGYAKGGLVAPNMARAAGGYASSAMPAPNVDVPVRVINTFDASSFLSEALGKPEGERLLLNFVRARPAAFRQALGR